MKIEIWSDVVCPFCYIGKRKFEKALNEFHGKDRVKVEWKSFQLDPETKTDAQVSVYEYLAERKGMSVEHSKEMHQQVAMLANEAGLDFNFDKTMVANTFDAHRILHLAAKYGKQTEAEERLFAAYFTEGKNIADFDTLVELAKEIGIKQDEAKIALENLSFTQQVNEDIHEAQELGIRGVPFFVFNRKFAVSGAQSPEIFAQALQKAWEEDGEIEIIKGDSCEVDGDC